MDFRLLGNVEIRSDGERLTLGRAESAKTRCILAVLLRTPGELVTTQALTERVWGGQQPPGPQARYKYVGWLRAALRQVRTPLIQRDGGYLLAVDPAHVDLHRFRRLVGRARTEFADGRPEAASRTVDDALGLWEGTALTGLTGPWVELFRSQLDRERREAIVLRVRAAQALGGHGALVDRLAEWEGDFPLDEVITGLLMLALYRDGRQVEALSCYQRARDRVRDLLDTEPGPQLRALAARIQARDPALLDTGPGGPAPASARPSPREGRPPVPGGDGLPVPGGDGLPVPGGDGAAGRAGGVPPAAGDAGWPARAPVPPGGTPQVVPRQLPCEVIRFVGRARELARLSLLPDGGSRRGSGRGAVPPGGRQDGPAGGQAPPEPAITVIDGMAGVGKTALALHWAHQVAEHFPDGQLYADLRGFDGAGSPASARDVVGDFLDAFDVPPSRMPAGMPARVALYRSLLAGRQVLVVLDNARDVEQVRPLLPGSPGCRVLVTSRNRLTGLVTAEGAYSLGLRPLGPEQARELLVRRLGTGRVGAQPDAVADLVRLCAGLPLALSIVAARAVAQPDCPLSLLVEELREVGDRLDVLDGGDDPRANLRAVLSTSHRFLSEPAARLLRLMSVHPGPDISLAAAASLGQLPRRQARAVLRELTQAHLLEQVAPGRFTCHELQRAYEQEQVRVLESESGRRTAARHALDYYLHTARAAALQLAPDRVPPALDPPAPDVLPEDFHGPREALSWFETEYRVLLAIVEQCGEAAAGPPAWHLPWTLATFMDRRGRWGDLARLQRTALAAADRLQDEDGQARAHQDLARALIRTGAYRDAEHHLGQALDLLRRPEDRAGRAQLHRSTAWLATLRGRYDVALAHVGEALDLCRQLDDGAALACALTMAGRCHALAGRHEQAVDHGRRALSLHREAANVFGTADTWRWLGYAHHHLGHRPQAVTCYEDALHVLRDLGDPYHEADVLTHLGDVHLAGGDRGAAHQAWWAALSILDELRHPDVVQVRSRLDRTDRRARGRGLHQELRAPSGGALLGGSPSGAGGVSAAVPAAGAAPATRCGRTGARPAPGTRR